MNLSPFIISGLIIGGSPYEKKHNRSLLMLLLVIVLGVIFAAVTVF